MEKIFEILIKLIPLGRVFEKLGTSKEAGVALTGLIAAILVFALHALYIYLNPWHNLCKGAVARTFHPQESRSFLLR
jgi:hypothetical protein